MYVLRQCNIFRMKDLGRSILSIKSANPTYADDIALIELSPLNLQRMVDIVLS